MVSKWCGYDYSPAFLAVLGIAVWLIYTLDHLLDARRLGETASTPRHKFHHRYFRQVSWVWGILALLECILVFWQLETMAIWFGLVMGGITLLHLALVKVVGDRTSPLLIKESGVAFVYAAGVWGLPILITGAWERLETDLLFFQFLLLALINLLLFSYFELETDEKDKQTSFVRAIGERKSVWFIGLLLLLMPLTEIISFLWVSDWSSGLWVRGILWGMWLILAALWAFPKWFSNYERYRTWGDGAFLLPILSLLWEV